MQRTEIFWLIVRLIVTPLLLIGVYYDYKWCLIYLLSSFFLENEIRYWLSREQILDTLKKKLDLPDNWQP